MIQFILKPLSLIIHFLDQKVSVAFSTGDVKSLCSDMVVKVPDRFHGKSSHEEGVPPVQRRALQLAEEAIQREKKPDICSGYPVQPALNYATSELIWLAQFPNFLKLFAH